MTVNPDQQYDVVVVGAGTGLLAAITAADAGLRVLVVEKSRYLGGSTAMSGGGIWVPGNSVLREAGALDTRERALTYLDALVGDTAPRERRVAFVEHGGAAIDVLRRYAPNRWAHMPGYADYRAELPGGSAAGRSIESEPFDLARLGADRPRLRPSGIGSPIPMPVTGRDYRWLNLAVRHPRGALTGARRMGQGLLGKAVGREYAAGGQALAAGLILAARRAGVEMRTQVRVDELVVEGGRVAGLVVTDASGTSTVRASRGVVLASGGFDRAPVRRKEQSDVLDGSWSLGNRDNTGDVLDLAVEAGAHLTLMDQAWWFPALAPVGDEAPGVLLAERSLPGSIIVDGSGRRFFDESSDYMRAGQIMLGTDPAGDGNVHVPAWLVFDQRYRNSYVLGATVMPGAKLPAAWYEAGIATKADSMAELAAALELPGLADEVARFNVMAAQGHDDDFGRGLSAYGRYYGDPTHGPNPCLGPLDKGPFYAVRIVPGDLGTCGGVAADEFGRALREDGSAIDGLYAIGNAAGNAFGHFYPGAGATIGQGLVFGYLAARHAAGRVEVSAPPA